MVDIEAPTLLVLRTCRTIEAQRPVQSFQKPVHPLRNRYILSETGTSSQKPVHSFINLELSLQKTVISQIHRNMLTVNGTPLQTPADA